MSLPITSTTPSLKALATPRVEPSSTAHAQGVFTRSSSTDSVARRPMAGHGAASAASVHQVPRFTSAQMKAMGAEILDLYKQKVTDRNERSLTFSSEGEKYSIKGFDLRHILIHSDKGIVELSADGTPRSHDQLKIGTDDMTLALMRTLATLRHHTPTSARHA